MLLRISVYTNVTLKEPGLFFTTIRIEVIFNGRGFSLDPSVPECKANFFLQNIANLLTIDTTPCLSRTEL